MTENIEFCVARAAEEFRAAERAATPQAAEAHRLLAAEYVHLIKCDGNVESYRFLRRRRERKALDAATATPLPSISDAA